MTNSKTPVMLELRTTYRQDYLWPVHNPYFPRTDLQCNTLIPVIPSKQSDVPKDDPCAKASKAKTTPKGKEKKVSKCETDCKMMTEEPLKNLTLGPCPKMEVLTFSEIDNCIKKLFRENPEAFVDKKFPGTDALRKCNEERLKTSYQTDYDHIEDQANWERKGFGPCANEITAKIPQCCRPSLTHSHKELMSRRTGQPKKEVQLCVHTTAQPPKSKRKSLDDPDELKLKPRKRGWSTEYRAEIGNSGLEIMNILAVTKRQKDIKRKIKRYSINPFCVGKISLDE